jgi:hypothetical protein
MAERPLWEHSKYNCSYVLFLYINLSRIEQKLHLPLEFQKKKKTLTGYCSQFPGVFHFMLCLAMPNLKMFVHMCMSV